MEQLGPLQPYIPLLIPIVLIELGLMIAALIDLVRRERTKGPKWLWVIIIIFFGLIGPIVYFVVGRDE